jgi:hypothetical protein
MGRPCIQDRSRIETATAGTIGMSANHNSHS